MIRIASSMIGIAVACACWNAEGAVAKDIRPPPRSVRPSEIPTLLGQ